MKLMMIKFSLHKFPGVILALLNRSPSQASNYYHRAQLEPTLDEPHYLEGHNDLLSHRRLVTEKASSVEGQAPLSKSQEGTDLPSPRTSSKVPPCFAPLQDIGSYPSGRPSRSVRQVKTTQILLLNSNLTVGRVWSNRVELVIVGLWR